VRTKLHHRGTEKAQRRHREAQRRRKKKI